MKKQLVIIALLALASCKDKETSLKDTPPGFISIDSANKMVNSYLASVNYPQTDTNVLSFTFNAKELRCLLDSTANADSISQIQIKLAHSLDYINSGHANMPAGFNKNALRLLISGVDSRGNYIFMNNEVLDHSMPCPNSCPPGIAGTPLYN